jgi:hypothetical protein
VYKTRQAGLGRQKKHLLEVELIALKLSLLQYVAFEEIIVICS